MCMYSGVCICVHMYIHTYEKYTTVSPEVKQSDKESQHYKGIN